MFGQIKISTKIWFLVAIFLLALVSMVAYSFQVFQLLERQVNFSNYYSLPLLQHLRKASQLQLEQSIYAERALTAGKNIRKLESGDDDSSDDEASSDDEETPKQDEDKPGINKEAKLAFTEAFDEYKQRTEPVRASLDSADLLLKEVVAKQDNAAEVREQFTKFQASMVNVSKDYQYFERRTSKAFAMFSVDLNEDALSYDSFATRDATEMDNGIGRLVEALQLFREQQWELYNAGKERARQNLVWMGGVWILLGAGCSWWVTRRIVGPLKHATFVAERLAIGDTSVEIRNYGRDEIGLVINAMHRMLDTLKAVTEVAITVSHGDYGKTVEERSDKDQLAQAINSMSKHLENVNNAEQYQSWIKTGQTQLFDHMRGEQDVSHLTKNVVTYLAKYIGAEVGIFYVADSAESVQMTASYAFTHRKQLINRIRTGEGIVGQALLERETLVISEVPDDYISISSGLGHSVARHLLIVPVLQDKIVKGVIELGMLKSFAKRDLEFIASVNENIAIAINSAQAREQMRGLLDQSQAQSEKLKQQQEELKATNDEMEQVNRSLGDKTEALEKQAATLEAQKGELALAKLDIEEKVRQLEQSSKYKSQFLANMSHELRTPLNSLLLLANSLAENEDKNLNEEQIESAWIIKNNGEELLSLINDILDLSKVEAGKLSIIFEDCDLDELTHDLRRQFAPIARQKQLQFVLQRDPSVRNLIRTDTQRIRQILKNLLSNAFKFTAQGGVTLSIHRPDSKVRFFDSDRLNTSNCIALSVIDTGVGIPKDKQDAIFEAFQQADGTTSRKFGGTGLGLTISRELGKLLGGEIQLRSEAGKGATFSLYLPFQHVLDDASANRSEAKVIEQPVVLEVPKKHLHNSTSLELGPTLDLKDADSLVLIVEDDHRFATILQNMTAKRGLKSVLTASGEKALKIVQEYPVKAIILDMGLPDMDGSEVLRKLKSNPATAQIPVHIISGRDVALEIRERAEGFISKPASIEAINRMFGNFEQLIQRRVNRALMICSNSDTANNIRAMLDNTGLVLEQADSIDLVRQSINHNDYDCLILDIDVGGELNGMNLISELYSDPESLPPCIVYTTKQLSADICDALHQYQHTTIVQHIDQSNRLMDEVSLFLHSMPNEFQSDMTLRNTKPARSQGVMFNDIEQTGQISYDPSIFKQRRILLVDDDVRNTFALSKALRRYGMQVDIADNGQLALDKLAANRQTELVLMDIMMPVMDGYEAMRQIRAQAEFASLPIIALTAKTNDQQECLAAGATAYETKPIDLPKLLALMARLLAL
jgi:signal transduction histidine kinase/DNA-binding response OmpR family regulator/HAMP domain-containing protein